MRHKNNNKVAFTLAIEERDQIASDFQIASDSQKASLARSSRTIPLT